MERDVAVERRRMRKKSGQSIGSWKGKPLKRAQTKTSPNWKYGRNYGRKEQKGRQKVADAWLFGSGLRPRPLNAVIQNGTGAAMVDHLARRPHA